jgi:hypothetical protein
MLIHANNGNSTFGSTTNFIWSEQSVNTWANNWTNSVVGSGGDPVFVANSYRLQETSPCVDAGGWLTTCDGDGSGTSLTVADANYFFPGIVASGTAFPGDTIQLQGQTNTATITAISGNTLTLSASLTWTNGQGVSLAYSGSAPDIGAFEFAGETPPEPPVISGGIIITNAYFNTVVTGP